MAGLNRLTGTVWHVERFERQEGDDRRHRSRCVNYKGKPDGYCSYYCGKCRGAAHCDHYKEKIKENESVITKQPLDKSAHCLPFNRLKFISLKDVVIDHKFADRPPKDHKVEELIAYYKEHRQFDKPIIVECKDGKYVLVDKYLRYVAAKKLGLREVPAEMGTPEELEQWAKLRKKGTLVWHYEDEDVGIVIETSIDKIKVKFDSGKEAKYDIYNCLQAKTIRPM